MRAYAFARISLCIFTPTNLIACNIIIDAFHTSAQSSITKWFLQKVAIKSSSYMVNYKKNTVLLVFFVEIKVICAVKQKIFIY